MRFGTVGRRVSLKFRVSIRKVRKNGEKDRGGVQRAFVAVTVL